MSKNHKVAGIGEILWDMFPNGSRLGGAPFNFASHCGQLGCEAYPVSVVGRDRVGVNTRERLSELKISDKFIFENTDLPTGRVLVLLDSEGKPSYEILEEVAWDDLVFTSALCDLAVSLDAACFGTLAQRSPRARSAIHKFLEVMPTRSLRIYDVNLRHPFFSKELVKNSLQVANVLKLSDEELPILAEYFRISGGTVEQLQMLRHRFGLSYVAYTRGREGSVLVTADAVDECAGVPVNVDDTVGAGDAFTAALTFGLLNQWPLDEVNQYANEVAAFVCSQQGATPRIPSKLIRGMLLS